MNLKEIKQILSSSFPEDIQRKYILSIIAKDKNAIPDLLQILNNEREENKKLISDSNIELSRALITLKDPNIGKKNKSYIELDFVIGKIKDHYLKWKDKIECLFKIDGLP